MIHTTDDKNILSIHKWEVKPDGERNDGFDIDGFIINNDEIYSIDHFNRSNGIHEFLYVMITMRNNTKYRIKCEDTKPILKNT